jgi:hypothetical protein
VYIITLSSPVRLDTPGYLHEQGTVELLGTFPPPPYLLLKGTNHSLSICVGWRVGNSASKGIHVTIVNKYCWKRVI